MNVSFVTARANLSTSGETFQQAAPICEAAPQMTVMSAAI